VTRAGPIVAGHGGALLAPWRAWLAAIRPRTLAVGAAPVVVGSSLAFRDGAADGTAAALALAVALSLQIGANLVNDAADAARGADGPDRLGPPRAVASGWLSSRRVMAGAVLSFAVAIGAGLALAAHVQSSWLVLVGAACIAAAVAYTAGPAPLAYHGLGEAFVVLFFGLVATGGTYFVQAREITPAALLLGGALGLAATAVLVVNNLRDRDGDARAGKRTLAVRHGAGFARAEHAACLAGALALVAAAAAVSGEPWILLGLAALPLAAYEIRAMRRSEGAALNARLAGAARFCLLLALATGGGAVIGGRA
jgi:1,4-dihydroxy-2-naphthoate octaprenyltransferase